MTFYANQSKDPNLFHPERVAATRIVTGTDFVYDVWLKHYEETAKRYEVSE